MEEVIRTERERLQTDLDKNYTLSFKELNEAIKNTTYDSVMVKHKEILAEVNAELDQHKSEFEVLGYNVSLALKSIEDMINLGITTNGMLSNISENMNTIYKYINN